jgi:hypothetical protein
MPLILWKPMIGFVLWRNSLILHNVMTDRRCCLLLDNSREKLRIGGSHMSMVAPPMLPQSLGRSLERTSELTIYLKE